MISKVLFLASCIVFSILLPGNGQTHTLLSPEGEKQGSKNGRIIFNLEVTGTQKLYFNVSFQGISAIQNSPLGPNIDNRHWGENVQIISENKTSYHGSYPYTGNHSININHYNQGIYTLKLSDGTLYYLDVRVFSDGVALRYRIPANSPKCIYGDGTTFTFPTGTKTWYASGPFQYGWIQAYQERTTDQIEGELLAPPATFQLLNGTYAAITESNLSDFHGAVLLGTAPNQIKFGFVENRGHVETGIQTGLPPSKYWHSVVLNTPWIAFPQKNNEIISPWRILMLADNLNELVNNDIVANVADKPDTTLFADTEWIKPGRSVFTWLTEGDRHSLATYRKYVRGAQELALESVLVDEGWESWPTTEKEANGRNKWEMLKELAEYGKERNVDIWVWRASSPRYGNKKDIGLLDPIERADFMKKCASAGVKGIKIDFFHTENVFTVRLMESILKDAAKEKLMVVFHGVNKPTGDSRTYPNLLAKEAVRGLECVGGEDNWAPGPAWPYHNTVLPFTRWLAGAADYTPLNFRNCCPPSVTFAHQLASIYVFTSPMLILGADMEDMLQSPGRDFIKNVAVDWDETIVLPESQIGELAALARRKGDTWYVSVLNGEKARTFETTTDFLPKGIYQVTLAADGKDNRKQITVTNFELRAGKKLRTELLSGGGIVARFNKK